MTLSLSGNQLGDFVRSALLLSLTHPIQPPTLYASPTKSLKTRRNLKGSRKLQLTQFTGGFISGVSNTGGTATGVGSATTKDPTNAADASSTGAANFMGTSGSSGFIRPTSGNGLSGGVIITSLGVQNAIPAPNQNSALGSANAGAQGSQAGAVSIANGGTGTLKFDGTTAANGAGSFGGGFTPVGVNTVTAPDGTTSEQIFSQGATGGFAGGSGALSIAATTTGSLMGGNTTIGAGLSGGTASNSGGGMAAGTNGLGSGGGTGFGTGMVSSSAAGTTKFDNSTGVFVGTGGVSGDFNNNGSGIFGAVVPPRPMFSFNP
jgi:hypothetical protein